MADTPGKTADHVPGSNASESPAKYVPQFSAATEMILKRIGANSAPVGGGLTDMGLSAKPAGYEDMKKTVLQGMKTTYNMDINTPHKYNTVPRGRQGAPRGGEAGTARMSTPGTSASAASGKGKASARGKGKAGMKRKRGAREDSEEEESEEDSGNMSGLGGDSEEDSDAGSIMEMPKITQSGRQVVKPIQYVPPAAEGPPRKKGSSKRTQEQALCKRCGRGNSPQSNMIVFCDGCNLGWHQRCHEPYISDEQIKDEDTPWFCADCSRKRGLKSAPVFDMTSQVGGGHKTTEEKRAYFNSLLHSQLVSLLMHATTLHPNIPLFAPSPRSQSHAHVPVQAYIPTRPQQAPPPPVLERKAHIYPQQPFPASATAGLFSRAEAHPNATMNFIRKIPSPQPSPSLPPYLTSIIGRTPSLTTSPLSAQASSTTPFAHAQSNSNSAPPNNLPPHFNETMSGDAESRESTPVSPPYPKPGQGLMAKLGADEEDIEWLVDEGDYGAFSHVIYGEDGEKVEENGLVV